MCTNTDKQLREFSRESRYRKNVNLLITAPGIGRLRSIEFLVALGNIKRFNRIDKLCKYVGLIPSCDTVRQGELTYRGHKQLKTMLIEAAWVSMNTHPAMALNMLY